MKRQQTEFLKLCLADALVQSLEKQSLDSIHINALCTKAGIGRTTFYRLVSRNHSRDNNKYAYFDELLRFKIHSDWAAYEHAHPERASTDRGAMLMHFIYDSRSLITLLHTHHMVTTIMAVVEEFLFEELPTDRDLAYAVAYMVYGYFGIIYRWIQYGFDETPEQVQAHILAVLQQPADKGDSS